jgi:hypothetical protein
MVDLPSPKIPNGIFKTITVKFTVKGFFLDTSGSKRRGFSYGVKGAHQEGLETPAF